MGRDWYRQKTWSPAIKEEFMKRLSRTRTIFNKAQYLRIQAYSIEQSHPREALELLNLIVAECPDEFVMAQTYHQLARCHLALGNHAEALRAFESCLHSEKSSYGVQTSGYL